jgi:FAD/FMN-containing dehydrogenase
MKDVKNISLPAGSYLARGEEGYEAARRAAVWHAGVPDRYPDIIVLVNNDADVVAAVRAARDAGLKISVRSGGRSWSANGLRDGGMLIDLSRLRDMTINPATMRATVQPGLWAADFVKELVANDVFFPGGHCVGVAMGGYLLQGGYGWSGRAFGPACGSIDAIDVVTADGELVRADATQNSDLFWAARGAGPGFFGVVTRFYVHIYPLAQSLGLASYRYPVEVLPEVLTWLQKVGPSLGPKVEVHTIIARNPDGVVEISIAAAVFASTEAEAHEMLQPMATCPVLDRALAVVPYMPASFEVFLSLLPTAEWEPYRWFADNIWVNSPVEKLLPGIQKIVDTLPAAPSWLYWMTWSRTVPGKPLADMAFDLQEDASMALYAAGADPADDDALAAWVVERMRELEPMSSGTQLADENLGRRPQKFMSDDHMARLAEIRAVRDPEGRFNSWMHPG